MARVGSRAPTEEEFAELVHTAWPALYRTALLLTGDHGLAEDLAQSALATTYSKWHRLRDTAAARGYARQTLINSTTSWFRRPTNRSERPTEVLPERADGADPGRLAVDRVAVLRALAQLAPRQRAVVVLRFYEDQSVQQTADALGISTGTVKSQTSAALSTLRGLLGDDVDLVADPRSSTHPSTTPTTSPGGHHG